MLTSESIAAIMPALIKAQGEFKPAVKDSVNPAFARGTAAAKPSYVSLAQAIDSVSDALRANGIGLFQMTDIVDGRTVLETRLIHASGEWIAGRYPVHAVKADPQGEGSALTYARRYALMALVGIAPEDDDGNAATTAANKAVDAQQAATLQDMAESCGADVARFCAVFGAKAISEIPAAKFDAAVSALKSKAAAQQKAAE